jgi:hypothetical protein
MQVSQEVARSNFWQHVSTKEGAVTLDRDRAVEYVRRYCKDAKLFRLFLMGAAIAFNQIRNNDREVIHILADFRMTTSHALRRDIERVDMHVEYQVEDPRKRTLPKQHFYDLDLFVNAEGLIVGVDFNRLANQIGKSLLK